MKRFYAFVTLLSIFLAESCSRSDPRGMTNPIEFLFLRTVYGLYHLIVDPVIIYRGLRRDRRKVYAFGALFGLYEFPITKVYYEPGELLYIHQVNVFNVLRIGFFRHALMSFTFPFYLGLFLFTNVDEEFSRRRIRRIVLFSSFFFFLFFHLNPSVLHLVVNPMIVFFFSCLLIPKKKLSIEALYFDSRPLSPLLLLRVLYSISRKPYRPTDPAAYAITLFFLFVPLYAIFFPRPIEEIPLGKPIEVSRRECLRFFGLFESLFPLALLPMSIARLMIVATILFLTPLSIYLIYESIKPKKKAPIEARKRDRRRESKAYLRPTSVPIAANVPTQGV